jgi:hypothetical protein
MAMELHEIKLMLIYKTYYLLKVLVYKNTNPFDSLWKFDGTLKSIGTQRETFYKK